MLEMDQYALLMTKNWQRGIEQDLEKYEFHPVVAKLQIFCSEDLGSFYLDVLKDRLYTMAPDSHGRRSAQTALHHITHALLRIMAPMLSFTAEEAWPILAPEQAGRSGTIFTETWYEFPAVPEAQALEQRWTVIREVRSDAFKEIESLREAGELGSSLQAELDLTVDKDRHDALAALGDDLRFVMMTSRASLQQSGNQENKITVTTSDGKKCQRCWHYDDQIVNSGENEGLCPRCVSNLHGHGETRTHA
jgi:isoleucyl-tRNA synthetase